MNANEVIRIGRNRARAASIAAVTIGSLCSRRFSRATSTIRIAFFAANAISSTRPICVYRLLARPSVVSVSTGPSKRQRHREDHAEGGEPTFVLSGQAKIDQQHAHPEHKEDLSADDLLLVRHRGPFVAKSGRHRLVGDLLHQVERLTGAEAIAGEPTIVADG
jgi:hypothetical protein